MASPKSDRFPADEKRLARYAKALSHPARIAILRHIASCENLFFYEISRELPLADSTVSQHISELKKAGLIEDAFDPPRVRYSINRENWKTARKYLREFTHIKIVKSDKL